MEIGIAVAFVAGLVAFASPCFLPVVPVFIGQLIGGTPGKVSRKAAAVHALVFIAGFSVVFIGLWGSIALLGNVVGQYAPALRVTGGVVLIVMGLHIAGLIAIPFLDQTMGADMYNASTRGTGVTRSALMGIVFGAGWTPCIGPILGGILALASQSATAFSGIALMLVFCAGLGTPIVAVAVGAVDARARFAWFTRHHSAIAVVSGAALIALGFLMVTGLFGKLVNLVPSVAA